jgi:hypothetical protein
MYNDSVAIKPVENGPSAKAGIKAETVFYADKTKLFGQTAK